LFISGKRIGRPETILLLSWKSREVKHEEVTEVRRLHFPEPFKHRHPPIQSVNELFEAQLTVGQRTADWVAKTVGAWSFIIGQSILLVVWVILNITAFIRHWDPYPFILGVSHLSYAFFTISGGG
jgi:uncharacterized membrane protein